MGDKEKFKKIKKDNPELPDEKLKEFFIVRDRIAEDLKDEKMRIFVRNFAKANTKVYGTTMTEEVQRLLAFMGGLKLEGYKLWKIKL